MARTTAKPVVGVLSAYDDTFLHCRNLGHVWAVAGYYREGGGEVRRRLDCQRCGTERTDRWTLHGDRLNGRYTYIDGYRMGDPVTTLDVRREILARAKVYTSRDEMLAAMTNGARR